MQANVSNLVHNGWSLHVYPHRRAGSIWAILIPNSVEASEFISATTDRNAHGEFMFTTSKWCPIVLAESVEKALAELSSRVDAYMSTDAQLHVMKLIIFGLENRLDSMTMNRFVLPENIEDHKG